LRQLLAERQPVALQDPALKPSSVLLVLYRREGTYHTLLTARSPHVGLHPGEVCFPGGAHEPHDRDLVETALREGREEIGVDPRAVEPLGVLDQVRTRTGFFIQPVVGRIPYPYPFQVSREEVAELLEVPLHVLLLPAHLREEVHVESSSSRVVRSYAYQSRVVFGATARILTDFLALWKQVAGDYVSAAFAEKGSPLTSSERLQVP
jgi:8-oxo-dGTP pyrophosphatase MutT (NUDIX family)